MKPAGRRASVPASASVAPERLRGRRRTAIRIASGRAYCDLARAAMAAQGEGRSHDRHPGSSYRERSKTRRITDRLCRNDTAFRHASHLPGFNPHLTKSRLNDGPRLCETLDRNMTGHGTSRGTKWNRSGRKVYE